MTKTKPAARETMEALDSRPDAVLHLAGDPFTDTEGELTDIDPSKRQLAESDLLPPEAVLERLQGRRESLLSAEDDHAIELAWVDHRIKASQDEIAWVQRDRQ